MSAGFVGSTGMTAKLGCGSLGQFKANAFCVTVKLNPASMNVKDLREK